MSEYSTMTLHIDVKTASRSGSGSVQENGQLPSPRTPSGRSGSGTTKEEQEAQLQLSKEDEEKILHFKLSISPDEGTKWI
jgi:hypothetical protein